MRTSSYSLMAMNKLNRNEILSSSSAWVAAILNIIPGLGAGYLYQRRWKAYWLTLFATLILAFIGIMRQINVDSSDPASTLNDQFGLYGVASIAIITSIESILAVNSSRKS